MSDSSMDDEAKLIERILERLDASVDGLDDATLSRLEQARRRAVGAAGKPRRQVVYWPRPGLPSEVIEAGVCGSIGAAAAGRVDAAPDDLDEPITDRDLQVARSGDLHCHFCSERNDGFLRRDFLYTRCRV